MSGMTSNSHTSRETESHSMASTPVTSAAAVKTTKVTSSKPLKDITFDFSSSTSVEQKARQKYAAAQAMADQRAAEKKKKKDEEKKELEEKAKVRNAKLSANARANIFDTLARSNNSRRPQKVTKSQRKPLAKQAIAKQNESKRIISKKMGQQKTEPKKNTAKKRDASATMKQQELPNAETDSAFTETSSTSHGTSSSPVPTSASGDVLGHDEPLMSDDALTALYQEIAYGHSQLTESQREKSTEFLNEICNSNFSEGEEIDIDDIPYGALQKLATWIKDQLVANEAPQTDAGGLEDTQAGATQSEFEQTEQSEPQLEKSKPSALADGIKKRRKRHLDDDDDEQVTSEPSKVHRNKRARSLEPSSSPREKNARVFSRRGSLDSMTMPSSIQNSVTVYSATVTGGSVSAVTGGMIPFGADGNVAQKYRHLGDQRFNEELAEFKKRDSAKQVPKRRASEAQLDESGAKKAKHSDDQKALLKEAEQATEESTAEAKTFKQEDIMEKPEVASSADTDHATPVVHTHDTATSEDASATETEPTTKEEADSTNGHQDATQGDNKTSKTSDEKSAESSSNQTAAATTKQQGASHSGEAESTPKTQDGQKSVKKNASTTTSGSATKTTTQQKTAQKSKKSARKTNPEPQPQRKSKAKASSTPDVKKSTSKASAVKQPRFVPSSKQDRERDAAENAAFVKALADKTNTHRQPTKSDPKKTPAASKNKQPEAAKKPSAPTKSAASNKRKLDEDDIAEGTTKAAKQQRKEPSKKRSRKESDDEDEEDDTGTQKAAKKQRTNPSSTSAPTHQDYDDSEAPRPTRASRSKAAREKADVERAAAASRQQTTQPPGYNFDLPSDGYDTDDETTWPQPQSQAQTQVPSPVNEDEQTEENEQKDGQSNEEEAEHEVEDHASNDSSNTQGAPTTNNAAAQPQRRPNAHIAPSTAPTPRPQTQRAPNNRPRFVL